MRTLVISLHEGIVGEAAATRSAVLVEDVQERPALPERHGRGAQRAGRAHGGARQAGGRAGCAIDAGEGVIPSMTARC